MRSADTTKSVLDTPPRFIPSILFSSTFRLSCLRCVLVTGTISMAYQIYWKDVIGSVLCGVIVLHHLLSAFGPRFIPLFTWLDLLLMLAELAYGIMVVVLLSLYTDNYQWFPKRIMGFIIDIWLLTIMLAFLLCLKVIQLVDARWSTLSQRLDILRDRVGDRPGHYRLERFSDGAPISWWRYPVHVLFGRKIWERKLPGESFWISLLRGLLALVVMLSLATFGLFEIVFAPISEMGLTPNKVFRSERLPATFNTTTPMVWNLIVVWPISSGAPQTLRESISLKPEWGALPGKGPSEGPFGPACDVIQATQDMLPNYVDLSILEVIVFHCPPRIPIPPDQACSLHTYAKNWRDTRPNLVLEANFTGLMGPEELPNTNTNMVFDSLQVYLALTNNTKDALLTTRPTPLFPGLNLVGMADLVVRQRLKVRELSTFGLFDLYDTFMIADIPYTTPEPRVDNPQYRNTSIPMGTNVSTLRIGYHSDAREWTVMQDYRDKSVLGGIAAVGGLGSFLSVLFVICFGNSLFGIAFRTKSLTPFGIVHQLENQRVQLSTSVLEKYSGLRSDLQSLKDSPGLLAFLLDTLIDLDVVIEGDTHRANSKRRLTAKLRDVEQGLSVEKYGSDSESNQERPSTASQRSVRKNSNGSNAESFSSDSDGGDAGEGPRELTSKETNEQLLEDDERRPLVAKPSSS